MFPAVRRDDTPPSLLPCLALGIAALLLALLLRAPANLLQKALPPALPLTVTEWGGTLWQGQASVVAAGDASVWNWRLQPLSLLRGSVAVGLAGQGGRGLRGSIERGVGGTWRVRDLQGEVPAGLLQQMLPPGWSLPGEVSADGIQLARRGLVRGAWTEGAGRLRWGGGPLQFSLGSGSQAATLPPLLATLALEEDKLLVRLAEEAGGGVLAEVRLAADGGTETRLRERLLRYVGRTSGTDPDAVVVTSVQGTR